MSNLLHVCLYNVEPEASRELRSHIVALNFVRLVGEADSPEDLAKLLQDKDVDVVFFHLDPDPTPIVDVIDQVSTYYPDMALVAISHELNPQAILGPMRAGCEQFVCEPIDDTDLANAVARVAARRLSGRAQSRCICVSGQAVVPERHP